MILGGAAAAGGYALAANEQNGMTKPVPSALMYGGLLTLAAGGVLTYLGLAKARNEHPLDQSRASRAAINYNTKIANGDTGTTTTSAAQLRSR
jgi:hypothetical protein